ncbi:uncharacterized protein C8Q71DRAFT_204022 [Rhodofomes roseus]|uniref:Uncharacterized protein n=1 Tax=Rhodofomes roseus TaxID=34475 RepID=A0ABQ8KUE3_9APHY|nr:uncharacterized protein C8Q71DRAFT_204022 [Rhodofomes roseus]KAH9842457.1 hypothetical protein C8Q71DRAFT_204022 [Rhodofomes roseus]
MPSIIKSSFLALLLLVPLVHPSPVIPTGATAHTSWRLRNDPETLLGRRYVVQNHVPSPVPASDGAAPLPPRSTYASHQATSRRSTRFAKYLAERAATSERIQIPGGTVVSDNESDVGAGSSGMGTKVTKAGNTELDEVPSSNRPYSTAVTLVPRPSGTAHAKTVAGNTTSTTAKHRKAA